MDSKFRLFFEHHCRACKYLSYDIVNVFRFGGFVSPMARTSGRNRTGARRLFVARTRSVSTIVKTTRGSSSLLRRRYMASLFDTKMFETELDYT